MKIVHHDANGHFDWLISGHQGVNPSREVISILSGKDKICPSCDGGTVPLKTSYLLIELNTILSRGFYNSVLILDNKNATLSLPSNHFVCLLVDISFNNSQP